MSRAAIVPGAYDTPSSYAESARARAAAPAPAPAPSDASAYASNIINATPQLPAYVLRPESYDDVETVVRRVRTKQPVALIFVGVRTEVAKRVLDFSYGFACGLGATVKEVGDRVFMVLPAGCEVKIRTSRSCAPTATLSKLKTRRFPSTSTPLSSLVNTLFNFYSTLIVVYCFMTWIPMKQGGLLQDIAAVLDSVCGPWLNLFRRFIPPMGGVIFRRSLQLCVAVGAEADSAASYRYTRIVLAQ